MTCQKNHPDQDQLLSRLLRYRELLSPLHQELSLHQGLILHPRHCQGRHFHPLDYQALGFPHLLQL